MMRCRQLYRPDRYTCIAREAQGCSLLCPGRISQGAEKQDDQMQNRVIILLPLPDSGNNINIIIFLFSIFMPSPSTQVSISIEDHLVGGDRGKERAKVRRTSGENLDVWNHCQDSQLVPFSYFLLLVLFIVQLTIL